MIETWKLIEGARDLGFSFAITRGVTNYTAAICVATSLQASGVNELISFLKLALGVRTHKMTIDENGNSVVRFEPSTSELIVITIAPRVRDWLPPERDKSFLCTKCGHSDTIKSDKMHVVCPKCSYLGFVSEPVYSAAELVNAYAAGLDKLRKRFDDTTILQVLNKSDGMIVLTKAQVREIKALLGEPL